MIEIENETLAGYAQLTRRTMYSRDELVYLFMLISYDKTNNNIVLYYAKLYKVGFNRSLNSIVCCVWHWR